MENNVENKIKYWLSDIFDEETKNQISDLQKNDAKELYECFYKDLEFGTGGLRGIMGVGTNRMNKYTVGRATQGLANYLIEQYPDNEISVAIAYDSRNNSKSFAKITASVFSANNIKVFLFDDIRPTPELSFAVRHLKCKCGIVITASHNPKEYNGYKVYWKDGGQIVPPHDYSIIEKVNSIIDFSLIKFDDKLTNVEFISAEIDEEYLSRIISLNKNISNNSKKDLRIVFSPIHGTTGKLIPLLLSKMNYNSVFTVEEQMIPDGNFPTVKSPNPEEQQALTLAINLAKEKNADIVCCTDPDGDRLGVAVKDGNNNYVLLNGNQTATILTHYILSSLQKQNKLSKNDYIVKTIVTTSLLTKISDYFNIKSFDVLTGFKYIAETIELNQNKMKFICGGEESYGFLVDDFVRDKDAVLAALLIIEAAQFAKENSFTLIDYLKDIYLKFNFYREGLKSITKYGNEGNAEIVKMMYDFRNNLPEKIINQKLVKIFDYENSVLNNLTNKNTSEILLPKSNVIQYELEDGTLITIRPSGTEPKIKFYVSTSEKMSSIDKYDNISSLLDKKIEEIFNSLIK